MKTYKTQVFENAPQIGDIFTCVELRPNAYGIRTTAVKTKVVAVEKVPAKSSFGSGGVVKHYDHAYLITSVKVA